MVINSTIIMSSRLKKSNTNSVKTLIDLNKYLENDSQVNVSLKDKVVSLYDKNNNFLTTHKQYIERKEAIILYDKLKKESKFELKSLEQLF